MIQFIKEAAYVILVFFIGLFIVSSFFIRAVYNTYLYGDVQVLQKQKLGIFISLM